jgi:hypothetical protein
VFESVGSMTFQAPFPMLGIKVVFPSPSGLWFSRLSFSFGTWIRRHRAGEGDAITHGALRVCGRQRRVRLPAGGL